MKDFADEHNMEDVRAANFGKKANGDYAGFDFRITDYEEEAIYDVEDYIPIEQLTLF
jgi:hypothetical protein